MTTIKDMTAAEWGSETAKVEAHHAAETARFAHPEHCFCDRCSDARNAARRAR